MDAKVIRRVKLTELINPVEIHSVIVTSSLYGRSLAIAVKDGQDLLNRVRMYYESPYGNHGVYYIPLDKFTYSFPSQVAFPKESYSNIVLLEKKVVGPSARAGDRFITATITKKIVW